MSKPFFEVFPTLKVKDDIQMMFQGVEVTKVSTNSTRDFIRVSIYSRHLIQKKDIYEVERMLKQQLFAGTCSRTPVMNLKMVIFSV